MKPLGIALNHSKRDARILKSIAKQKNSPPLFKDLITYAIHHDDWGPGGAMPIIAERTDGNSDIHQLLVQSPMLDWATSLPIIAKVDHMDDADILIAIRNHPRAAFSSSHDVDKKLEQLHRQQLGEGKCSEDQLLKIISQSENVGILEMVKSHAVESHAIRLDADRKIVEIRQKNPLNRSTGYKYNAPSSRSVQSEGKGKGIWR